MDRFIECVCTFFVAPLYNLKSSMDRFIATFFIMANGLISYLKSSMDRFIGRVGKIQKEKIIKFKIQYG